MHNGLLDKNSHHREQAYGKTCRHRSYNHYRPRYTHCNPDTFFCIELPKVWRVRQVPDWKTEKEKNWGWGMDLAPVAVPDYKRYKL